jgi:hypothetical protein
MSWEDNKRWADHFMPEVKQILGGYLIREPHPEEDYKRNTDLIVLSIDQVRIGVRIRRNCYLDSFGDQFTIRAGLPNGTKTELQKIMEGWGDLFFYGFCDPTETRLARWTIGDLEMFRVVYLKYTAGGHLFGQPVPNLDGTSGLAFRWITFPRMALASSENPKILEPIPRRSPRYIEEEVFIHRPIIGHQSGLFD